MRHGGQLLIHQLKSLKCERVFSKPGQNSAYILDGLYENAALQTITCRHESGAAIMAEAHGQLTGSPGVCVVSGAMGAVNAASGVEIARRNGSPMVLLVGLPSSETEGRGTFCEIDLRSFYGGIAKHVAIVDRADRIPELVSQAFVTAVAGAPGPVVLGFPENVLAERSQADAIAVVDVSHPSPSASDLDKFFEVLGSCSRPLMIIGGSGWNSATSENLARFAEKFQIPVAAAYDSQDATDNFHICYVGHLAPRINPKLDKLVEDADLIIALGTRLDDMTTSGFTTIQAPKPRQQLIQISTSPEENGKTVRADLLIHASPENMARELSAIAITPPKDMAKSLRDVPWGDWREASRRDYEQHIVPEDTPGDVKLEYIVRVLNEILPDDAILTYGHGNYTSWLHRYRQYRSWQTRLSPNCEAADYGLPAAIAAKLQRPERTVVCVTGDGGFLMSASELATAALYGLKIVVIVVNNRMYGAARKAQEQLFPGRVLGASVSNPDILKFSESFGAEAEVIEHRKAFRSVLKRCLKGKTPSVIELRMDENAMAPDHSLLDLKK